MGLSLDGLEKTHDTLRSHPGLFHQIMHGIHLLQEAEIPTRIVTTVNALNVGELPSLLDLLIRIGIREWQVQPVLRLGRVREETGLQPLPGRIRPARFVCTGFLLPRRRWRPRHNPCRRVWLFYR